MKRFIPLLAAVATSGHLLIPTAGHAQQVPDWLATLKLPNSGAKTIMTPTAWGAAYGSALVGVGATDRTPYLPSADGIVGLGYGMGDPVLTVGLQIGTTVSDLSEFDNLTFDFKIHRYLAKGTTVAVGGESLFSSGEFVDDAGDTFYLVVSHVVQAFGTSRAGEGRFHLNLGFGSGRFWRKSDRDFSEGKGRNGTGVFGAVAVEVVQSANVVLEWTGTNLLTGVGKTVHILNLPVSFSLALDDLTDYTGDGVRVLAGFGFGLPF